MVLVFIKFLFVFVGLGIVGVGVFFWIMWLQLLLESEFVNFGLVDVKNGEIIFWVGGCESCYVVKGVDGDVKLIFFGGVLFLIFFGIFYLLNILLDEKVGIGKWMLV